jgi:proton glutamate symport protein
LPAGVHEVSRTVTTTVTQASKRGIRAVTLPVWVVLGALAGIVAGVVFGERTALLQPLGSA